MSDHIVDEFGEYVYVPPEEDYPLTRGGLTPLGEVAASFMNFIDLLYEDEDERLRELRGMPYHEYLQTPEWQELRRSMVRAAGFRCQNCGAGDVRLEVHHKTYERLGQEHRGDLVVLCWRCHGNLHGRES